MMTYSANSETYQAQQSPVRSGWELSRGPLRQTSTISTSEIETQLLRMLTTDLFSRSERMSRFLGFIVSETLEGREEQLNQYTIGLGVFDKPDSFDPITDPIVRVEAGRLRAKLREYDATSGVMDRIQIGMARVGYKPFFRERTRSYAGRW